MNSRFHGAVLGWLTYRLEGGIWRLVGWVGRFYAAA